MSKKTLILTPETISSLASKISGSRKYRDLGIPAETIRDLIDQAAPQSTSLPELEKTVKEKMHNLVAPYLGDPDYEKLFSALLDLPRDLHSPELKDWCLEVLRAHASTRERIPILEQFYGRIFEFTGLPGSILDLACGLNPFTIPWMQLPVNAKYFAYDLHQPRISLIDSFFKHIGQTGGAFHGDILVQPPQQEADVAFFFKEAHRFEQRQHGVNRAFFQNIPARYLLVSLPTASLTGKHSKLDQDRRLIKQSLEDLPWPVHEIIFENEIVFCIEKTI